MDAPIWIIVRRGLIGESDATVVAFTDESVAAQQIQRLRDAQPETIWPDFAYDTEQCWIDDISLVDEQIAMDKEDE